MLITSDEKAACYQEITETTIIAGRAHTGERFRITRRSDGRFGYVVMLEAAPWIEGGSETSEAAAGAAIEKIMKERCK